MQSRCFLFYGGFWKLFVRHWIKLLISCFRPHFLCACIVRWYACGWVGSMGVQQMPMYKPEYFPKFMDIRTFSQTISINVREFIVGGIWEEICLVWRPWTLFFMSTVSHIYFVHSFLWWLWGFSRVNVWWKMENGMLRVGGKEIFRSLQSYDY